MNKVDSDQKGEVLAYKKQLFKYYLIDPYVQI